MAKEAVKSSPTSYEEALNCLCSLVTRRTRADGSNKDDHFDLVFDYLKILELEEPISKLNVIHVAGTKGKEKTNDDVLMPTHFRFLALLGFKIFSTKQVDVAILEVGLDGKFDATNVMKAPVVCGIFSLGHDHMEILGNTLGHTAGEKAGIFKQEIPTYAVPQTTETMSILKDKASNVDGQQLGLHGEHQYLNTSLAIALSRSRLQRTEHVENIFLNDTGFTSQKLSLCQINVCIIKVNTHATTQNDQQVDVSWQLTLRKVWENLIHGNKGPGHWFFYKGTFELTSDQILSIFHQGR